MLAEPMHYSSGEEVHAGDRVQFDGTFATIVFVSDGESEEFQPGYSEYTGSCRGLVFQDDDGATTQLEEPDERLYFVDRG